jgi:hypothetical protein
LEFTTPGAFQQILQPYLTEFEGDQTLDFNKIIPMPKELEVKEGYPLSPEEVALKTSNLERYGFESWYHWRLHHWGTKWNSYCPSLQEDSITFDTAWSPPIPVIERIAVILGIPLTLDYCEEGNGFIGRYTAEPDGSSDDEYYNIDDAPEWLREIFSLDEEEEEETEAVI